MAGDPRLARSVGACRTVAMGSPLVRGADIIWGGAYAGRLARSGRAPIIQGAPTPASCPDQTANKLPQEIRRQIWRLVRPVAWLKN